jgi:hypothetical protein
MDPFDYFLAGVALITAGAYGTYAGLRRFLHLKKIRSTPLSTLDVAQAGTVEVEGDARPFANHFLSIDGRSVVYRKARIEQDMRKALTDRYSHWKVVLTETEGDPFIIRDDTGSAEVQVGDADFLFDEYVAYPGAVSEDERDRIFARYESRLPSLRAGDGIIDALFHDKSFRVSEQRIFLDSPLTIRGTFDADRKFRALPGEKLLIGDARRSALEAKLTKWLPHLLGGGAACLAAGVVLLVRYLH